MTIAVTVLSAGSWPCSTAKLGHGLSSSFSAIQQAYLAGVPWVAWSSTPGRNPNALIAVSRIVRPIVALARNPEPKMLPLLLTSMRSRTGPFTSRNGAEPVVLCHKALVPMPWARNASRAASTVGKYSGRQPAITALMAARRSVQMRFRCGIASSTSPGSRSVCARNGASSSSVHGTTGNPSVQPFS